MTKPKSEQAAPVADPSTLETPHFIAPDALGTAPEALAAEPAFWLWCGLVDGPSIGKYAIQIGGIAFVQTSDMVRLVDGRTEKLKYRGFVTKATRSQLEELARRLPQKVLRINRSVGEMLNADERSRSMAKGMRVTSELFSTTTTEERAARRAAGLWTPTYSPEPGDTPIARHVFIKLLGTRTARLPLGETIPEPLSVTGLQLPGPDCPAAEGLIAWPDSVTATEIL